MLSIIIDLIQFIETALLFSIALFCIFIYIKTRDSFIGRVLGLILPTSFYFVISYSYSYFSKYFEMYYAHKKITASIGWVSYFFAIFTIVIITLSIITVYRYGLSLLPVPNKRKKTGIISIIPVAIAFLIISLFLTTLDTIDNPIDTLPKVIWDVYPVGSLPSFILAVVLLFYLKKIKAEGKQLRLARFFLISFLPQAVYTALDFVFLQQYTFQFTHISYLVFSLSSFYYISSHYFQSYESTVDISFERSSFINSNNFSSREIELLELLIKGRTNSEIAELLHISINTVKSHIKNIYRKSSVTNRVQLLHKIREFPKK